MSTTISETNSKEQQRLENLKKAIMDFVDETDESKVFAGTADEFYGEEESYSGRGSVQNPARTRTIFPS